MVGSTARSDDPLAELRAALLNNGELLAEDKIVFRILEQRQDLPQLRENLAHQLAVIIGSAAGKLPASESYSSARRERFAKPRRKHPPPAASRAAGRVVLIVGRCLGAAARQCNASVARAQPDRKSLIDLPSQLSLRDRGRR